MFLQSIKFLGFVAIVTAGTLGTIVVGQQAKEGRDPGSSRQLTRSRRLRRASQVSPD